MQRSPASRRKELQRSYRVSSKFTSWICRSYTFVDIVEAFEKSLERIDWMDEQSARKAREKAEAIRKKVGYPLSPDTRDARSLVSYYTLVKVHVDTFFENVLSAASVVSCVLQAENPFDIVSQGF